ncbi:MAG: NAD-dependent epimerase/dehydratase family protein [Dehalococcoidia bacterium]
MNILITGAAGNLGSHLARYLVDSEHNLRLMVHRRPPPPDLVGQNNVTVHQVDLGRPDTLPAACAGVDCIVHLAGILFQPRPERFLQLTNVVYTQNLLAAASEAGVRKFTLISFPHVEGDSSVERPATGRMDGQPDSVHAQTRLQAERELLATAAQSGMTPVILRSGMIYGRGVLMVDAFRRLARYKILAVWPGPTWIHLISLPDFLAATKAAIESDTAEGVYNVGDDLPLTFQEFLDRAAAHWGYWRPWRLPGWSFYVAATAVETFASIFRTSSPLTRDFIRIGMASNVADTTRMRQELLPELAYPTLNEGIGLL